MPLALDSLLEVEKPTGEDSTAGRHGVFPPHAGGPVAAGDQACARLHTHQRAQHP